MLGRERIAVCLAAFLLLTPSFAQNRHAPPPPPPQPHPQQAPKEARPSQNQPGHAGNWLRHYKNLPPAEQRRELENDPQFRKLPPHRQAQLQKRLQHFSNLPPQQQERVLNRMETWEHLTQDQKHQARQLFQQFKQLPPDRRQAVNGGNSRNA